MKEQENKLSRNEIKKSTRPVESSDIHCALCGGQETGEDNCDECNGLGANVYESYRRMKREEYYSEMYDNQYETE